MMATAIELTITIAVEAERPPMKAMSAVERFAAAERDRKQQQSIVGTALWRNARPGWQSAARGG